MRTSILLVFITLFQMSCNCDSTHEQAFDQAHADSTLKAANDSFYGALNDNFTGNTSSLEEIWSHGNDVSDQGPFGARLDGWDAVDAEFKKEGAMKLGGKVVCKNLIVRAGKEMGYTACIEEGENMSAEGQPVVVRFRATNIF
ncbi:MAG: YybH family protein, partial [Bacteroidota bacterium]